MRSLCQASLDHNELRWAQLDSIRAILPGISKPDKPAEQEWRFVINSVRVIKLTNHLCSFAEQRQCPLKLQVAQSGRVWARTNLSERSVQVCKSRFGCEQAIIASDERKTTLGAYSCLSDYRTDEKQQETAYPPLMYHVNVGKVSPTSSSCSHQWRIEFLIHQTWDRLEKG